MKNKMFLTIATITALSISSLSLTMKKNDINVFWHALANQDINKAREFINSKDFNVNELYDLSGRYGTILHYFTWQGMQYNETMKNIFIELLQNPKINVNALDSEKKTPLETGARRDCQNFFTKKLLEHPDININFTNEDGDTALSSATISKNPQLVELLLKLGAKIDGKIIKNYLKKNYLKTPHSRANFSTRMLHLAHDYDNAESNRMQFLDNLWKEREAYRAGKSTTPNKYGLENAYNILAYRSMIIKPLKTDPGYKDETKRTLFSGKTREEMRKLLKFAEVGFTEAKSEPMNRIQTETPSVTVKSGERKKFVPLTTETKKKK